MERRTFVRGVGAVAVAGAVAGCSQSSGSNDGGDGGDGGDGPSAPKEVSDYLSETSDFDGNLTDETGKDTVTVEVGASGNGGNYAFAPAAIKISTGTEVQWKWTGKGGGHNVVAEDDAFDSGSTEAKAGVNFTHTFDEAGTHLYYCLPHKGLGMKGAIVVSEG
ncbi:MAG: halocyanin domain-containing protein [Haloarculaceae archaeon]